MPNEPDLNPAPASASLKTLAAEKSKALHPKDSVQTAGDRMREHDAEVWPVAEDRKLVGTVDEKNPDWKACGHGHDPKASSVGEIMKRDVIFCYEDEDCAVARRKMAEHGLQVLPVVDRDLRIVGVFTREEIEQKAEAHNKQLPPTGSGPVRPAFEA
jgi:CBS-domain-containing membrane protein